MGKWERVNGRKGRKERTQGREKIGEKRREGEGGGKWRDGKKEGMVGGGGG